jgi:hypothetical protein
MNIENYVQLLILFSAGWFLVRKQLLNGAVDKEPLDRSCLCLAMFRLQYNADVRLELRVLLQYVK